MSEAVNPNPEAIEAILVMDSRQTQSGLRSQTIAGEWTRLYRVGPYYLDLTLKAEGQTSVLMGQFLQETSDSTMPKGMATLHLQGQTLVSAPIGVMGEFRLPVAQRGPYQLMIGLPQQTITVSPLEI
jgi:hypothetical protein